MARALRGSHGFYLGCDPELFIVRDAGKVSKRVAVVGSERILPAADPVGRNGYCTRDGVQVELHAFSTGCRQSLSAYIRSAFTSLQSYITDARVKDPTIRATFAPMVTLTKGDKAQLSPEALILNCKPSLNAYGREQIIRDGNEYPIRTASGHLHMGSSLYVGDKIDMNEAVRIHDVLVGISCVLIDQDPSQKIRRETYGRAGEYRLPKHGLEYRVPGNFWLKDYVLQSFIFAAARLAGKACEGMLKNSDADCKWARGVLTNVDFAEVERVINENDFDGALRIYKSTIRPFGDAIVGYAGFGNHLMNDFEFFVHRIRENAHKAGGGLSAWFNVDDKQVMSRWLNLDNSIGWENFLGQRVYAQRQAAKFTGIILDPVKTKAKSVKAPIAVSEDTDLRVAA